MSAIPYTDDVLDQSVDVLQLADVAKILLVPVTRVHQHLRERDLIAIRRDGVIVVPTLFFEADHIVKPLPGVLSVLYDGGYGSSEILRWLFTADETLSLVRDGSTAEQIRSGAMPIEALHGHQAREVIRRAQAMAF
ncbi:MAG: Rv2175c family DNA-binding protein [Mycobacteriaceae bacterium]